MKLLVINSGGKVGHVVALYFKERGHEVIGYNETNLDYIKTVVGSLYDTDLIEKEIKKYNYDAVINCTAVINQFADQDKAAASYVNSYFPHFLEKITINTSTVIVHRSTDCIFSGERGQYGLDDIPDATSFYARTKVIGEIINDKDITIRTSLIGPETNKEGNGLFNWYFNQQGEVTGFANAIWTGLSTIEFAREIEILLLNHAHGLFHLVPNNSISKFELLLLFEKYFPGNRHVVCINNKLVDKSLIQSVNGYEVTIPDYESMIEEMVTWINSYKKLYTHYIEGES